MATKGKKKRQDWPLVALVSVVAILSVILFVYGPQLFGGGPEFTVIIHYAVDLDSVDPSASEHPGSISVTGNITNIGTEGGTPVVHLTIFTGNTTEAFSFEAAPCLAGDHVAFTWSHHFSNLDRDSISIECKVVPLKT